MRQWYWLFGIGAMVAQQAIFAAERSADCTALAKSAIKNATVDSAQLIAAGTLKDVVGLPAQLAAQLPEFCRVAATLRPTKDSEIKIEVWLPSQWNDRFVAVGNGGLAGSISYAAMAGALRDRYATASTDTGHTGNGASGEWALGHSEKIIDFAHRSEHEMTLAAKELIKRFYGRAQKFAYWNGCSEGGNQALHEAQRYPNDYDGIVAGAPANYMTHLQVGGLWISHAVHKDPASSLSAAKLPSINRAVVEACDEIDGLQDGIVGDPRVCAFDVGRLRCRGGETDQCLTVPQLNGLAKIYAGAKSPHTSQTIFPGYMQGSELEWSAWIAGTDVPPTNRQHQIAENFAKYLVFGQREWDWKTFDFAKDVDVMDRVAGVTNAIDPDLSAFKRRGGKLLQYHGWYDPAISPLNSVSYFTNVQKKMGDTSSFYRLFMVPGMAHCGGGPGVSNFDRLAPIVKWVEEGKAPDTLLATRTQNETTISRPICPYPASARYKGMGNVNDAESFACVSSSK